MKSTIHKYLIETPKGMRKKLVTLLALVLYFNTNAQIIITSAGDSIGGYTGDGGYANAEELNNPYGVATDQYRNLYIADMSNSRVRMVITSTGIMTTIAGSGTYGYAGDGGAAKNAQLTSPYGIALDAARNVYIADYDNYVVRKVTTSTGLITTIAGNNSLGGGYTGDGSAATAAQLAGPMGVAVDASGNVYIADYGNNVIRMVAANTGNISTFAGNGTAGYGGDGSAAKNAQLNKPTGVAIDASGNLYIADYGNNVIRMVAAGTGNISTVAGNNNAGAGYSGDGAQATAAQLFNPWNITVVGGNLYIADYGNHVIRKVINGSGIISTIAGNGTLGYSGDCGTPTAAQLNYPASVALDSYGNLFIADNGNNGIRKVLFSASKTHVTANTTNTVVCSGSSITLSGGGASTYTWTGGAINGTPFAPVVTATVLASYSVTGTDSNQCMGSASILILENPLPVVTANSSTICAGQYATLSGLIISVNTQSLSYNWTGGVINGVPFMPNTTSGYIVTGTDGNGCSSSGSATVTVIAVSPTFTLPVISVLSSGPISACGGSCTLTASGATTYSWNTGQVGASVVVTPNVSTTYSVTGSLLGCNATGTVTQVVNTINVMSSVDSLCSGSSATLTASTSAALASNQYITYAWALTSTTSTTTPVYVVTPTVSTTYTVTGTISTITTPTSGINDTSHCVSNYVYNQVVRAVNVSSNTGPLCNGSSTVLVATGASTYTWNPGNQNGSSITVTPTVSTTYTVTGTTAQSCAVTGTIQQLVTSSPLTVSISSSIDTICIGGTATLTASGANNYFWNNTFQPGASIVITPTATTTYSVVGSSDYCSAVASFVQNVNVACFEGIKELKGVSNQIVIYPNPAINGSFTISMENNTENTNAVVLNALGQKIFEVRNIGQQTQVAIPNCLPGVYYVQISNGGTNGTVKKVIVE